MDDRELAGVVLERHGRTFADEAGIDLRDAVDPLFRLLCLSLLLATERNSEYGLQAVPLLLDAGFTSAPDVAEADPEALMDVLAEAKYARRLEQHADRLQESARHLLEAYDGDLRQLRTAADADVGAMAERLQEFKGIADVGSQIFLREVQAVWPEVRPSLDDRARGGAAALGLPTDAGALGELVAGDDLARLVCALVRVDIAGDAGDLRGGT